MCIAPEMRIAKPCAWLRCRRVEAPHSHVYNERLRPPQLCLQFMHGQPEGEALHNSVLEAIPERVLPALKERGGGVWEGGSHHKKMQRHEGRKSSRRAMHTEDADLAKRSKISYPPAVCVATRQGSFGFHFVCTDGRGSCRTLKQIDLSKCVWLAVPECGFQHNCPSDGLCDGAKRTLKSVSG